MRVSIVTDPQGCTHAISAETGEEIQGVTRINVVSDESTYFQPVVTMTVLADVFVDGEGTTIPEDAPTEVEE